MCSVIGYIGDALSKSLVLKGLARLEYRGYDSAGFACLQPTNQLAFAKASGPLDRLQKKLKENPIDGYIGLGHTRWATHGAVNEANAHPHFDCNQSIAIAHNGIIENHQDLRKKLIEQGHVFSSDTDSEIIAHLLQDGLKIYASLQKTIEWVLQQLEGAYAFIAILEDHPHTLLAARKGSPLCIGIGDDQTFIASDLLAFADSTNRVIFLPNLSYALVKKGYARVYDFHGSLLNVKEEIIAVDIDDGDKLGYEHFMLKEIYEQKKAIQKTISSFNAIDDICTHLNLNKKDINNFTSVHVIACGSSSYAAQIAQFAFEQLCNIPAYVSLASEFKYKAFFSQKNCLYIFVTQSGETADTLEALRLVNQHGLKNIAITNVSSSTVIREAGGYLLTQAGQEVSVASTKAFSTQVIALYWLAHAIAHQKGLISNKEKEQASEDALMAAQVMENCIETYKLDVEQKHAQFYAQYKKFIFIGRNISYPLAMEAALKLKEIAYIFAQAYPAGELKHGPIALIDRNTPIVIFSVDNELIYHKLRSNAQEVKARGGHLIVFAFEGQYELCELADTLFVIPKVSYLLGPLTMTGLMQLFVYHIAKILKKPIDKPRNLAKSVTVE